MASEFNSFNSSRSHRDHVTSTRRQFLKASAAVLAMPAVMPLAGAQEQTAGQAGTVGPVLGHVDHERICCFARALDTGPVELILKDSEGTVVARQTVAATPKNDLCVRFDVEGVRPGTAYTGELVGPESQPLFEGSRFAVRTPLVPNEVEQVTLGFGSCVSSTEYDEIWRQIQGQGVEAFCLLGDSPYIDKTELEANRRARRIFWSRLPSLAALAKEIPFWVTWDDHDFGKNDSDGLIADKENIRQAFLEYTALGNYGEHDEGIYTSFRRGPVEVWMVDDRWFSQTAPSWADPNQKTCLGDAQWKWLQESLKASTAPFKLLCCGMVWYPKGNSEKDHWETYAAEREAIFAFIKENQIPGVMILSGDIHVSRHHDYGTERLGYPLHECVISPMHASVIPQLDVEHPARVWSKPEPNVFLKMDITPERLTAQWITMAGTVIHELSATAEELRA